MKRLPIILAAGIMMLAACKDKKTANEHIITTDYVAPTLVAPIAMSGTESSEFVEWVEGRQYGVKITRLPVDTLPMAKDENGQEYIDNAVKVTVTRADNSVFFNRVFTKSAFASLLENDYRSNALLTGISLLGAKSDELELEASFNFPEGFDDESVALRLGISRHGIVSIERFADNQRDDLEQADARH